MRKRYKIICLIVAVLMISTVTYAENSVEEIKGVIDSFIVENEYGRIVDTVDTITVNDVIYYSMTDINNRFGYMTMYMKDNNTILVNRGADNDSIDLSSYGIRDDYFSFNMQVSAKGAILMEDSVNNIVFDRNGFKRLYPASTTKVMTALLTLENCNLDDIVTVGSAIKSLPGDSRMAGLKTGDRISVKELLYGLMLYSGNDCAVVLAEHMSGSVEAFAQKMNNRSKELGLVDTNFTNPHGYHNPNHYTTPRDLGVIALKAYENEVFRTVVNSSTHKASYRDKNGKPISRTWRNTNRFVRNDQNYNLAGTLGGKTGYTSKAGFCLVNIVERNNHVYASVMLGDGVYERYYDTKNIVNKACELRVSKGSKDNEVIITPIAAQIVKEGMLTGVVDDGYIVDGEIFISRENALRNTSALDISVNQRDVSVYINQNRLEFYRLSPFVYGNSAMVALDEIIDDIRYQMTWDSSSNSLVLSNGISKVSVPLKGNNIVVNGTQITIDKKLVVGDSLYVSIDFIDKVSNNKANYAIDNTISIKPELFIDKQ